MSAPLLGEQATAQLVERAAQHLARFGVVASELRGEVLHRVRPARRPHAVAPRHREVLELGEVGVGVRVEPQLEEVEVYPEKPAVAAE